MKVSDWFRIRMRKNRIKTQTTLAHLSGVSQASISKAIREEKIGPRVLKKIEDILGPFEPTEEELEEVKMKELSASYTDEDSIKEVSIEESVANYKGNSCPTKAAYCRGCYYKLKENDNVIPPETRAMCRLLHGWVQIGGLIKFREDDGTLITSDEL